MKTNAQLIVFAVKQAKAAQRYGFSRNIACRTLKTALHEYWQHRELRLHSQSRRKHLPRSLASASAPLSNCQAEHAVPVMVIVNLLMDTPELTTTAVDRLLRDLYRVVLVTSEEHRRLNASGMRYSMPKGWDGRDVWARYTALGIAPPIE